MNFPRHCLGSTERADLNCSQLDFIQLSGIFRDLLNVVFNRFRHVARFASQNRIQHVFDMLRAATAKDLSKDLTNCSTVVVWRPLGESFGMSSLKFLHITFTYEMSSNCAFIQAGRASRCRRADGV